MWVKLYLVHYIYISNKMPTYITITGYHKLTVFRESKSHKSMIIYMSLIADCYRLRLTLWPHI